MRLVMAVVVMLAGCAGSDGEPEPPTECDPDARRGTYLVEYTERSGNCGPLPEEVIVTRSRQEEIAAAEANGCEFEINRESEGGCRLDTRIVCDDGSEISGYTIAQDERADRIEGRITLRALNCRSTYDVTWTRE